MLIIVLILGASVLGVTTIAGYVSLQKIRAATNIIDSTKAIYAADAGIEWCLYNKFGATGDSTFSCTLDPNSPQSPFAFSAQPSQTSVEVREDNGVIKSVGNAGSSWRAFGLFVGSMN